MNNPRHSFKWPVAVSRSIAAPAQKVWSVISTPGNLETCHPFCAKNPVEAWPGPGSRDEIHYLSGLVFERRFHQWLDGIGYDLDIGRRGKEIASVSWRIAPIDDQNCALTITIYPQMLQSLPVVIRWMPHVLRVRPMLKRYLHSVLGGFDWYVTRGEPVPRNQFGTHPWFSGADAA